MPVGLPHLPRAWKRALFSDLQKLRLPYCAAVTAFGCETVSSGSRIAIRNAAFGSPHAIFSCVSGSEMSA